VKSPNAVWGDPLFEDLANRNVRIPENSSANYGGGKYAGDFKPSTSDVPIIDDISFNQNNYTIDKNVGTVALTINRNNGSEGEVSVDASSGATITDGSGTTVAIIIDDDGAPDTPRRVRLFAAPLKI